MKMHEVDIIAVLDLGTTRFRAVVAEPEGKGDVALLGYASLPARGIVRAELTDLPAAAQAIRSVVDEAAAMADAEVEELAVSVGGDHVRSLGSRSVIHLGGGGATVGATHLDLLLQRATALDVPFDRVILHCLPVEYTLDQRSGLKNPEGMVGARLELDAHVVTGTQSSLSSLDRAVELAGMRATNFVFAPCATASFLMDEEELDRGCLLIDIGGEVTHYALFYRGRVRQSGVVPVGGNHVTRDLAYGMELSFDEAERLKRRHGLALRSIAQFHPEGSGSDESERSSQADRARIAAICEPRQQEILELVAHSLQWGITRPPLENGVVLAGGGSRLRGTAELAEQVFTLRATTRRAPGDDHDEEPESWATALGLVHQTLEARRQSARRLAAAKGRGRIVENVKRWIDRLV
jgi:cell division protein FtsA